MVKRPKRASWSLKTFNTRSCRLVVLLVVLFSILPRVTFGHSGSVEAQLLSGPEVDFIIGPQASPSNSWFDSVQLTKARVHGEAFPATPPPPQQSDPYILAHYYDLGLTEYVAHARTGDPAFLGYARKVSDSWWLGPYIQGGTIRNFDSAGPAPRHAGIGGLALRALDGRPEMWDWINAYTRYHFDLWLKRRINDSQLYYGVREGALALHYATWLAKVLPDSFPKQAGGTETNGAALRAQYLADVEAVATNYYGRLQRTDGSWRWNDIDFRDSDGGTLVGIMQPFMVGLLLNALIDVHRLSTNSTVRLNIQNQITRACRHLYQDGPYRKDESVVGLTGKRWRSFWYFYHGGTTVNPTKYQNGGGSYITADQLWYVKSERQSISTIFSAYGYAYMLTGDSSFKTMGDDLFEAAFGDITDGIHNEADGTAKNYNQNYRMGGRYLVWRGGGSVPSPTPSPSPTPTASPSPTPTPSPAPSTASASFVTIDSSTKGTWKNIYGGEGYNTVNDVVSYPGYAQVSVSGYNSPTWMATTTDVRALEKMSSNERIAARWESNSSFTINLNFTDGQTHQVALYSLDWDGFNRSQRFDVRDAVTNTLLDSRNISSFNGGQYVVWNISGNVKITVNKTGTKTAVVSGVYFGGPVSAPTPTPSPTPTPTPGGNLGNSVGKAKRTGQALSNDIAATGTISAATSGDSEAQSPTQTFINEIQLAYNDFSLARHLFPRAADIEVNLTSAMTSAVNAQAAATANNLLALQSHLRKAIDHLALVDALVLYPTITNPVDAAPYLVRQNYIDFLNREPDQSGADFWINNIISCGADAQCIQVRRANGSAAFFLSIEFQQTGYYVYRLYRSTYGRLPLMAEFMPDTIAIGRGVIVGGTDWEARLAANKQQFLNDWVQRASFHTLYGGMSNEQYVDSLILNLGVFVSWDERTALVQRLDNGGSRASVLEQLATNQTFAQAEFNSAFVLMEYFGYLRRDPDPSGFDFWLNKLNEFNGNYLGAEMVRAFLESSEYRARFRF